MTPALEAKVLLLALLRRRCRVGCSGACRGRCPKKTRWRAARSGSGTRPRSWILAIAWGGPGTAREVASARNEGCTVTCASFTTRAWRAVASMGRFLKQSWRSSKQSASLATLRGRTLVRRMVEESCAAETSPHRHLQIRQLTRALRLPVQLLGFWESERVGRRRLYCMKSCITIGSACGLWRT